MNKQFFFLFTLSLSLMFATEKQSHAQDKPATSKKVKQIALTFDDAPMPMPKAHFFTVPERVTRFIDVLKEKNVPQVAFYALGVHAADKWQQKQLRRYGEAGHLIGNHTYHHWPASRKKPEDFLDDVVRCHNIIVDMPNFWPSFRFPELDSGGAHKAILRQRLNMMGYSMGYVTAPTLDWVYNSHLIKALKNDKTLKMHRLINMYVEHVIHCAEYFFEHTQKVAGGPMRMVMLFHENDINALSISTIIDKLRDNGWEIISPKLAYEKPFIEDENSDARLNAFFKKNVFKTPLKFLDMHHVNAEIKKVMEAPPEPIYKVIHLHGEQVSPTHTASTQ